MLLGFTDKWRQFHPVMLAICGHKKTADYAFLYDPMTLTRSIAQNRYGYNPPLHNIVKE
jgi:hypothetical protein